MATRTKRHREAQKALLEFSLWFQTGMATSIHNVVELKKANPPGIRNPLLRFVVPRAMNYVVERFVLEVEQAWVLVNAELRRQGLRTLGVSDKHYRHLKKIRNKLVAHKIENSLKSRR
jgi:proline dehydrogenase